MNLEWYYIVLITIAVIVALVGIGYGIYRLVKRFKAKNEAKKIKLRGKIQLVAVMRLNGSNRITGLETNEEVEARLSKLTAKEFLSLNIIAYPYSKEEWLNSTDKEIHARNIIEQQLLFAYDSDKKLTPKAKFIRRIFD